MQHTTASSSRRGQTDNQEEEQDNPEDFPIDNITDEEALLACRAYLQRRNKLGKHGWTKHHKRKIHMMNSLALGTNRPLSEINGALDEGSGYFWEDPTELKYLRTGRPRLYFDNGVDEFVKDFMREHDGDDNGSDWWHEEDDGNNGEEDDDGENNIIINEEESSIFTGFPTMPTKEFSNRSNGKKALFQNEKWKQKWYEARWGDLTKERQERRKEKKIQNFIKQIPSDILRSEELAALSDDEIEDAIRTYFVANQRRSRAQHKRMEIKRKMLLSNTLDKEGGARNDDLAAGTEVSTSMKKLEPTLDSFMMQLNGSSEANRRLAEERQRRSERAAMIYQMRMQHMDTKKIPSTSKSKMESSCVKRTAHLPRKVDAALNRIQYALDMSSCPESVDVEIILEPKRVSGRKALLKDILLKCFGMRGKCVPDLRLGDGDLKTFYSSADSSQINEMDKMFVTTCSVHELGNFVSHQLRQDEGR